MKASHFYLTLLIGFISLILSITLVAIDQSNQELQSLSQEQQKSLNQNAAQQQVFENVIREIAKSSTKDERLKELLARHGLTVNSSASAQ